MGAVLRSWAARSHKDLSMRNRKKTFSLQSAPSAECTGTMLMHPCLCLRYARASLTNSQDLCPRSKLCNLPNGQNCSSRVNNQQDKKIRLHTLSKKRLGTPETEQASPEEAQQWASRHAPKNKHTKNKKKRKIMKF